MHSNTILKSPAVVPLSPQRKGALYSAVATKANEETILCLSTERSVVLYFRWINENCTLEMLLDKKSDGFEDIEAKLANEVTHQARSQDFCWVGAYERLRLQISGGLGYPPPENFEKWVI